MTKVIKKLTSNLDNSLIINRLTLTISTSITYQPMVSDYQALNISKLITIILLDLGTTGSERSLIYLFTNRITAKKLKPAEIHKTRIIMKTTEENRVQQTLRRTWNRLMLTERARLIRDGKQMTATMDDLIYAKLTPAYFSSDERFNEDQVYKIMALKEEIKRGKNRAKSYKESPLKLYLSPDGEIITEAPTWIPRDWVDDYTFEDGTYVKTRMITVTNLIKLFGHVPA